MRRLIIVRPEPGASATAEAAAGMGIEVVKMPLFEVEPVAWTAPDAREFDALLITSANAVRHGGAQLDKLLALPAHCIGDASAAAARERGFQVKTVGKTDVEALLSEFPADLRLLHLCGEHRRDTSWAPQSIVAVPVYCSREIPAPNGFAGVEGAVVAVHSPRASSMVARLTDERAIRRARVALTAISEAAAQAAGTGWERVEIADLPTDARLLAIAARLCNNHR